MSTPQGPGQSPEWGQPPAGGWGGAPKGEQPDPDDEKTRPVTPADIAAADRSNPAGQQQGQQGGWGQQPGGQQQWGGYQQGGGPQGGYQQGGGQYGQQYGGQQQAWGADQQYGQQQYGQPQYGQQQGGQYDQYGQQQAWGQPGQAGQQQWGGQATQQWQGDQQQWGGQGGYPPAPQSPPRSGGGSKMPWIIVAVVVVVLAAVGVLGFVTPGFFVSKVFDAQAVSQGVTKILNDNYGVNASAVSCPANVKVASGATFQCDATVDGAQKKVPITVTSAGGDYQVGRPA
jgi:hypothetical protein